MSKYTPTTETVRERFADGFPRAGYSQALADFDRWLAAHDAEKDAEIATLRLDLAKHSDALALARFDTDELHRIRAGVVTEEPEWEYGFQLRESDTGEAYDQETGFDTEQDATDAGTKRIHEEDDDEYPPLMLHLIRRLKAGPWVPVKQEGATDA